MLLLPRQQKVKTTVEDFALLMRIDPVWAAAIAMQESSLGERQKSPTGCLGVFQMSSIAMRDLLQEMSKYDDDLVDIACGTAFLRTLFKRFKSVEKATEKYCDPRDRDRYVSSVLSYMKVFQTETV
jgi:membrane-bound lytic murein transglycosylase MltF